MTGTVAGDIPQGTVGTVLEMDGEDSDMWTYTIDWENGTRSAGIREYWLAPAPEAINWAHAALRANAAIRTEAAQANKPIPAVISSLRRLTTYIRQAADQGDVQSWLAHLNELEHFLEQFMYLNTETQEQIIVPSDSRQWNNFHSKLDAIHDALMAHRDQPGVEEKIQEVDEYHKMIQDENTPTQGLVRYKDAPDQPETPQAGSPEIPHVSAEDYEQALEGLANGVAGPGDIVEHSELGDEAEHVLSTLPGAGVAIDELLERWNQATDPGVKQSIENRIKKLHEMSLQAYRRIISHKFMRRAESLDGQLNNIFDTQGIEAAFEFAFKNGLAEAKEYAELIVDKAVRDARSERNQASDLNQRSKIKKNLLKKIERYYNVLPDSWQRYYVNVSNGIDPI